MITEIGKLLRNIRMNKDERLMDMANTIDVSPSFLSAVEKGHKSPPTDIEETIITSYALNRTDADALRRAADRSRKAFILKPDTEIGKDTIGLLARRVNNIPDFDLEEIQKILKKSESS